MGDLGTLGADNTRGFTRGLPEVLGVQLVIAGTFGT